MSLSRAFTTRRRRGGTETSKGPHTLRNKISLPLELIHTTNMLSYNAPDIPRPRLRSNSTNSNKSSSDGDSQNTADSTPPTSPDVPSMPEPNHLSCYFKAAGSPSMATFPSGAEAPAIPTRSPSHTKKNSLDVVARQQSVSCMSRASDQSSFIRGGRTFSRSPSTSTTASSASHLSAPLPQKQHATTAPAPASAPSTAFAQLQVKESHPFGQELAQVTELAEEYTVHHCPEVMDEEQQYLATHGLYNVSPYDYLSAIQDLSAMFFPERSNALPATPTTPLWI